MEYMSYGGPGTLDDRCAPCSAGCGPAGNPMLDTVKSNIYSKLDDYLGADDAACSLGAAKDRFQRNYLVDMIGHQQYGNVSQIAEQTNLSREHCSRLIKGFELSDLVDHHRIEGDYQGFSLDAPVLDQYNSHQKVYDAVDAALSPYSQILKDDLVSQLRSDTVMQFSGEAHVDYLSHGVFETRKSQGDFDYKTALSEFESTYIADTMQRMGYDKAATADALDVDMRTLERKMQQFSILENMDVANGTPV